MSVAFTQTAAALPPPGNDADGSVVGQSCGPVEHAVAPTIDQSTQRPTASWTSTHAAYGWSGHTACWPVQETPPSCVPTLSPALLLQQSPAASVMSVNRKTTNVRVNDIGAAF